jgi:rRNA maturation protein Nop10
MPILRHIPLTFTAEAILRIARGARNAPRDASSFEAGGSSSGSVRWFSPERQERFRALAEEMRALAFTCAAPAAAWERYTLARVIPETGMVTLSPHPPAGPSDDKGSVVPPKGGEFAMPEWAEGYAESDGTLLSLSLGESAAYLDGAAYVFAVVTTIGPELERQLAAFEAKGDLLRAYFLDAAGVLALECVAGTIRRLAREHVSNEGHVLSPTLLPGSAPGWPVEGQEALLRLAGGSRLGITITEGAMLRPLMSGSFLLGVGNFKGKKHPATLCTGCARYETCLWRQVEDEMSEAEETCDNIGKEKA